MTTPETKKFTVSPDRADETFNNYRIAVNADDSEDYEMGRMRVVPPFFSGRRMLDILSEDAGVDLKLVVTTTEATLIDFMVRENAGFLTSNEARVRHTADAIIDELGVVSSLTLFDRQFLEGN